MHLPYFLVISMMEQISFELISELVTSTADEFHFHSFILVDQLLFVENPNRSN